MNRAALAEATSEELTDAVAQVHALENAARAALLELITVCDERKVWAEDGLHSIESWVAGRLGIAWRSAAELVRVARALPDLPAIRAVAAVASLPVCATVRHVHWATVRLFIHVLAATVWVGGQLTLAGLVPSLRGISPEAPRVAARRFNLVAWPAYLVLIVTGVWNIRSVDSPWHGRYGVTLIVKLAVVAASGMSAFLHIRSPSRRGLAVWGAMSGLTAIAALFFGILLAG